MMRDRFFSMPRFLDYCQKDLVENWRTNVLRLVVMYGALAVIFIWMGYLEYHWDLRNATFYLERLQMSDSQYRDPVWGAQFGVGCFLIFIMGALSASFVMEFMKDKRRRISALMLPATMFEKYFSRWFIYTLVFLLAYAVAFVLADLTRVLVYSLAYPDFTQVIQTFPYGRLGDETLFPHFFSTGRWTLFSFSFYFAVQSAYVLGSALWPKNAFIKTTAALIVVISIFMAVLVSLVKSLTFGPYGPDMEEETVMTLFTCLLFAFAIFCWVTAYYRLKEAEIINRW